MTLLKVFLVAFLLSTFFSILAYRLIFNDTSSSAVVSAIAGGLGGGIALVVLTKWKMKNKPDHIIANDQ